MIHLRIEQNNIQENVSSSVITKLYKESQNNLDNTSNLQGNLHTTATYQEYIDFLTQKFPDLYINADKYYIHFEDPAVEAAIVSWNANTEYHWDQSGGHTGDGIGITADQAADIKYLWNSYSNSGPFKDNTQIETFNELPYFTRIWSNIDNNWRMFSGSSIREVNLQGLTVLQTAMFENCANLQTVGSMANVTYIGGVVFYNCFNLHIDVNMPNLLNIETTSFWNSGITSISNLGSITSIKNYGNDGSFSGCPSLKTIDLHTTTNLQTIERCAFKGATACETIHLPSSITTLGDFAFQNTSSLRWIKIDAATPPTITEYTFYGANSSFKIYVPDSSVSDYKSSTWSSFSNRIFGISQFSTDFPNN